jgi:hypothetical protein
LQCFFVVENLTANAVSVAIGDNGNELIFEIWWNFFYDLFSIKNVADVNGIDSFVRKRNMEEFSVVNESLRKVISHGPKFREPQHINWKHNFKIIMDAVEDYARRWKKREVEEFLLRPLFY